MFWDASNSNASMQMYTGPRSKCHIFSFASSFYWMENGLDLIVRECSFLLLLLLIKPMDAPGSKVIRHFLRIKKKEKIIIREGKNHHT